MAFFRTRNGAKCFTCFYVFSNQYFSGIFYELTDRSAFILSRIYKVTTILCTIILILEAMFPLLAHGLNSYQKDVLFASFFIIDALIIMPAGLMVIKKEKIKISLEKLYIYKCDSICVYLTIALIPLNYTIMMIWLAVYESFSSYLFFMFLLTLAATIFSVYRIRQILTNI